MLCMNWKVPQPKNKLNVESGRLHSHHEYIIIVDWMKCQVSWNRCCAGPQSYWLVGEVYLPCIHTCKIWGYIFVKMGELPISPGEDFILSPHAKIWKQIKHNFGRDQKWAEQCKYFQLKIAQQKIFAREYSLFFLSHPIFDCAESICR